MLVPFGLGRERYAVVGDDDAGRRLRADLTRAPGAPFTVVALLSRDLSAHDLLAQARELRLDGLILTADTDPVTAGQLAGAVSGEGVDVLLAPGLSGLEMRVASIAMLHGVPLLRATGLAPSRRAVRVRAHKREHGVAILGTRGIPANYGGFETFAERLALYLVGQGIPVTVYCRRHHATEGQEWRGVRLVTLPTIATKYLDTVVHTFLSTLHLVTRTRIRDVVLCNAANAPALPLLRVTGRRVVMNVDGLEWRRGKWGIAGRAWYRLGEWLSVRLSSVLVTDAEEVRTYYRVRHDTDSVMVPYGADLLERGLAAAGRPRGRRPTATCSMSRAGSARTTRCWSRAPTPPRTAEHRARHARPRGLRHRARAGGPRRRRRPTPCFPGRCSARATSRCRAMPAATSMPPRSAARIRR